MPVVDTWARRAVRTPWPFFGVGLLAAWLILLRMHATVADHRGHASPTATLAMWALMTIAMMAPTALPVLRSLHDMLAASSVKPWWSFLSGYLVIWLGFAGAATVAQLWLIDHDLLGIEGSSRSRWLTAALLLVAGGYQFSALKQRCATECVHPMTFFWKHWRDGVGGGMRMGLRHGVTCLGCCWALMLLAFVGGVSSIWFMVLSAAVMALEKLPSVGKYVTVPLGVALLLAGGLVAFGPADQERSPSHQHSSIESVDHAKGSR
jgi:predicted metal-binding membrane protein